MLTTFSNWLKSFYSSFWVTVYNTVIDFLQTTFDAFINLATSVISLFPEAPALPLLPTAPAGDFFATVVNCLNWLFPVSFVVLSATFIVTGYVSYVIVAPVARWLKLLT